MGSTNNQLPVETITLELRNPAKRALLLDILAEFDFVRVKPLADAPTSPNDENMEATAPPSEPAHTPGSIFDLAGMWAGRELTAEKLRAAAWKR